MKLVKDFDEYIDIGVKGFDGNAVNIHRMFGFSSVDIFIRGGHISWDDLDKLKKGIELAEKLWRKE